MVICRTFFLWFLGHLDTYKLQYGFTYTYKFINYRLYQIPSILEIEKNEKQISIYYSFKGNILALDQSTIAKNLSFQNNIYSY